MPGSYCAVAVCNNNYEHTKKHGLDTSFHTFPRNEKLKNKWIKACQRGDILKVSTATVCSVHFLQEDFELDFRAQLMNIKTKRRLKPSAVPTLYLNKDDGPHSDVKIETENDEAAKSLQKMMVDDLISKSTEIIALQTLQNDVQEKYDALVRAHENLKKKHEALNEVCRNQKYDLQKQKLHISHIERQLKQANARSTSVSAVLRRAFSQTQIDLLTGKKKKVSWSTADIAKAFTLWYLDHKSYLFLRNNLNYPLPHLATLQKWSSKYKVNAEVGKSNEENEENFESE